MQKHLLRFSIIFSILFFTTQVFAASEYNNELVRLDVDQTSDKSVKVNIYTDKPYKEQIIVNKKPDNKYVILLPETSNTSVIKPDISGISTLNNIDVKTQQYSSLPGKGYTKITIDSKTPIEVVPQAFVTKRATSTKSTTNRPYVSAQQVQMAVPQRILDQQKPVTNSDFVPAYERQRQANQQHTFEPIPTTLPSIPIPQQYNNSGIRRVTPQVQRSNYQSSNSTQPAQQTQQQPVVQTNNNSSEVQQDNATTESAPVDNQQSEEKPKNDNQAIDDATTSQGDDDISDDDLEVFKKLIKFKQKVVKKIKRLLSIRISLSSFVTVLQLILLIVLVIIIGDLVKKLQNPNSSSATIPRRLIHDNNETFEQAYPSYSNMDVYNQNRDTFEEDKKEGFNITPLSAPKSFTNTQNAQQNLYSENINYRQPQQYSNQDDFYKPLSKIKKEERMSIFDENAQDIEKTIFKNPLTSLSKQDEDKLFDEEEPATENTPFSDNDFNNNDDFFNYHNSSTNEEDFFIFEDEDEDEEDIEYQEDYIDEDEEEDDDDEYEYVDGEEVEETYDDNDYSDEEEYLNNENEQVEAQNQQPANDIDPFEHLTVHSKYVIDSNRGFAQVSVDGINALIGYIGSKISVIRKFKEEDLKDKMQVRLNEQPDAETMIYIVKVGSYKTLVEVKPQSIRQLLDL